MALATWWRGDALPPLAPLSGLTVDTTADVDAIARLTALERAEVAARLAAGHRIYVASLDGTPASYGWVATLGASIGELDLAFALPDCDRYLWDFVTLPVWRGRGIYPRLLQAIVTREGAGAERFWIIHAPENTASGAGITKAGFTAVGELSFLHDGGVGTVTAARHERAERGAALLGVALYDAVRDGRIVSPCWRCVIEQHAPATGAACWPGDGHGSAHLCSCVTAGPPAVAHACGVA